MNLLKDHSLSFYFDKNRVEVDSKPGNETGNSSQELILGNKSHPNVNINFGELETRAVWDTGAGITVVDTRFINSHPAFFQEAGTSTGTDSTGAMSSTPMFVMQGATIGGRRFAPTKVAAIDLAPIITSTDIRMDLILGYNLIKKPTGSSISPGRSGLSWVRSFIIEIGSLWVNRNVLRHTHVQHLDHISRVKLVSQFRIVLPRPHSAQYGNS